jgi:nucleotide-binding universal stress UspA family protein
MLEAMKGIIVGVDESPHACAALRWAVEHASLGHEPVTAVMAWGYFDQHHPDAGQPFDPAYGQDAAAGVLDDIVGRALGPDADVGRVAFCGPPVAALRDVAEDASMLVVGARGMGGFRGLLLGSVSRQVLHDAACPVTVVHDDASRRAQPVVVGVDGSDPSRRALAWAAEHARRRGVSLVAVHAFQSPTPAHLWYPPDRDPEELRHRASSFLQAHVATVDTSGVDLDCRAGDDRASAARLDAGALASLIVVGSRGHGQVVGSILGSVSDQVAHHATCPVVIVP